MDAVITGLFGIVVALLGIYGPGLQRKVSGTKPTATDWAADVDAELQDHERRLRRIEPNSDR